jgi:multisubunit Na+/H+ antiporter MnhG subunit
LSILNVVGFIAVLIINYLANALPIGGLSTGALSDLYPNLFVLAGLIFAIWGLIYLMLGAFVVWQLVDVYKKQSKGIVQKIGIWFLLSCLVNIAWIFAWQYQQVALSVGIIILFLAVLIVISYKVNIGKKLGKR